MITLLLKSSLRLMGRQLTLSVVKILGLAMGMAVFTITTLFTLHESSFDKQHPDYQNIFRYLHRVKTDDQLQAFAVSSATTGPALAERYSEVQSYTRVLRNDVKLKLRNGDVGFLEQNFYFADANFLETFYFPLKGGYSKDLLAEPYALLITPSAATRYFGAADPIGQSLLFNGHIEFVVKGIFEEDPTTSHFRFDFIASFATLEAIRNHPVVSTQFPSAVNLERKGYNAFHTYLKLTGPEQAAVLMEKLPGFIEEYRGKGRSDVLKPTLQSLASIHLDSDLMYEISKNGSNRIVYVYLLFGVLVLLAAIINYVNITTAAFVTHMQTVGIKKILGVGRATLLLSHGIETLVICLFSLVGGYVLVAIFTPGFNSVMQTSINVFTIDTFFLFLFVYMFTSLLSALFPAFQIIRQHGLSAFQGTTSSKNSPWVRNTLVFTQLFVAFILLSVSILIYRQTDYLLSAGTGFDADQIIVVNATAVTPELRKVFKSDLLASPAIEAVSMCSRAPGESLFTLGIRLPGNGDDDKQKTFYQMFVDEDFLTTLGVPLREGRFFSQSISADSLHSFVVNEAGAAMFGDSLMTRKVEVLNFYNGTRPMKGGVGVIEDFHFESLHTTVGPLLLEYNPRFAGNVLVRVHPSQTREAIAAIESSWKAVAPLLPLTRYFLDDAFAQAYAAEQQTKKIVGIVAIIVVCIASLGIFGTSLFTLQQRTKEIGVRKLLGSAAIQLFALLFRPTFILLLVASALAAPVALFLGNRWLSGYPYHVTFSFTLMLAAFMIILVIILGTVAIYLLQIIRIQPTKVLRQVR